jgi:DNA-binding NarL/FixJ family response regulator
VPSDGSLTYFSFHRLLGPITRQHRLLIARLMPHLHCTANRIGYQAIPTDPVAAQEPTDLALLSPRQREIMRWLICGKTNWEIGQITGTSEANVKYHLSNLMRSHAVSSRASLVFKLCKPAGSDARQTV